MSFFCIVLVYFLLKQDVSYGPSIIFLQVLVVFNILILESVWLGNFILF